MLVVENSQLLWTGIRELPGARLVCEDGKISRIVEAGQPDPAQPDLAQPTTAQPDPAQPDPAQPAATLDASGCITIPGLVNAHHHLTQSAFRTHPATRHIPMRDWLVEMGKLYAQARIDPPLVAAAAAVGLAESLLCGVTTVADHHLSWPPASQPAANQPPGSRPAASRPTANQPADSRPPDIAAAAIETARDMGCRFVFVHGTACGEPDEMVAYLQESLDRFGAQSPDGMFQLAVGPAGIHSDDQASFEAAAAFARQHQLRRRTQAGEQVDVEVARQKYDRRPLDLLEEWGWLDEDVTLAHLCDITEQERQRIARSGASATHAPGCDVPMGWGIAEVGQLLDAGVAVGLGTSGGGSNDAGHLLADARLAMQVSGLTERPLTAREALTMATAGSAAGLGRSDTLGHLEPGAAGDFCCFDVSGPDDAGVADPLAGLLWASPGRKPRHVVVDGRIVVRDWQLVSHDPARLVESLRGELRARLRNQK